ncbi:MAG: hypothetical protein RLN75_07015 [Longimicrobiales bacterium]
MTTRPHLLAAALLALLPGATSAQDAELQRPDGWEVRFDRAGSTEADLETFVEMPPGWHITTGPAGIFWDPATTAEGTFRIEAEIFLFDPQGRQEAFGVFFGGRDLQGDDQAYTYFLVRDGGQFIVKERAGAEAPTIQPWTDHEAVRAWADRGDDDATVGNVLAVEARADRVHFFVNEEEVASVARGDVPVDGIVGLRVNHRLNLHVSRLEVGPLGG